jgi:hypothetical protein
LCSETVKLRIQNGSAGASPSEVDTGLNPFTASFPTNLCADGRAASVVKRLMAGFAAAPDLIRDLPDLALFLDRAEPSFHATVT